MGEIIEKKRRFYSGLDADKASIPAGGKAIQDVFFATDTKISYFWDGVAWIIIPLDVIVAGMLKTDSVETLKIKDLNVTIAKAELGFGRYVPRAVAATDFDEANFTRDAAWHVDGLDLTGIVPEGAIAVHVMLYLQDGAANSIGQLRANATTKATNLVQNQTVLANEWTPYQHQILFIDADRLVDYYFTLNINEVAVAILGWFI